MLTFDRSRTLTRPTGWPTNQWGVSWPETNSRRTDALNTWIAKDKAFAGELAILAVDLQRSGPARLAEAILVCSRNFRVTALDLRGQLAATKPFDDSQDG